MKISEFIEVVGKEKNKKMNVILETKKYLPVSDKKNLVQAVLDSCVSIENGFVKVNSLDKYIMFTIAIISSYTNLEFGADGDALGDYDLLCESNLLDAVLETFAVEYERVNNILNMMLADIMRENSVEASIASTAFTINNVLDGVADALKEKINSFNLQMNDLDMDSINKFFEMLNINK